MSKTLLLAGATGLTGSKVLELVLNDDRYSKICLLVRKKTGVTHPKIHEMVVDFDRLQITQSVIQFDDVIIALGSTIKKAGSKAAFEKVDLTTVAAVADWAYSNGAQQCVLISSVGADAKSSNFYLRTKGKAEQYLSSIGFTLFLIYRPGLLLGERNEVRKGEKLAQALFGTWTQNISIFGKYSSILATQLAKAVVEGLNDKVAGTHILHFNEMKQYF